MHNLVTIMSDKFVLCEHCGVDLQRLGSSKVADFCARRQCVCNFLLTSVLSPTAL